MVWWEHSLCKILSTYPAAGHSPDQSYISQQNPTSLSSQKPDNKIFSFKPRNSFHKQSSTEQFQNMNAIALPAVSSLQQNMKHNIHRKYNMSAFFFLKKVCQMQDVTNSEIQDVDHFHNSNHYLL